ncbi:MAG TPA: copper chaperone [Deltaproteobacteria bacterium]|nr:copper chaperone [Deltaproteobacteria bacterium]
MHRIALAAALGVAAATVGCGAATTATHDAVVATHTATFAVEGMSCGSCSITVRAAVDRLDGIASVEVDVDGGAATVTFDGGRVTAEQIARAITSSGYTATVRATGGV